jgi:hypothetical protein
MMEICRNSLPDEHLLCREMRKTLNQVMFQKAEKENFNALLKQIEILQLKFMKNRLNCERREELSSIGSFE